MRDIWYLATIMKNILLNIVLLSLITACIACNKISEDIQQDIIVTDTFDFEIPAIDTNSKVATIAQIQSALNFENELSKNMNKFTVANIKGTKLKSLNLGLLTADGKMDTVNNFGNLETVRFRISANGSIKEMANANITSSGRIGSVDLTPTISPDSLQPFLLSSKTYNVIVRIKKATTAKMRVRAFAKYTITLAR